MIRRAGVAPGEWNTICSLMAIGGLLFCAAPGARAQEPAASATPQAATAEAQAPGPFAGEAPALFAVVAKADDRFGERVLAELSSLGFQAVRVDPGEEAVSRVALETAARQTGALAAIRAVASGRGAEVWIADRVTGKTVLREIPMDQDAIEPEAALAIRAVELLRASLLEASLPVPPPGEVTAPAAVRATFAIARPAAPARERPTPPQAFVPQPEPPAWRISVGAGALGSPGGLGPEAVLDVGISWLPFERLGFVATAQIPLSRPRLLGEAGSADVAVLLAGGGMRFVFTSRQSRWAPSIDAGLYAVSVGASGSANEGFTAKDVEVWTAAPFLRVGSAFAAHPMLRLRADLLLGATLQAISLELSKQPAATFGQPMVGVCAGVDFGWF